MARKTHNYSLSDMADDATAPEVTPIPPIIIERRKRVAEIHHDPHSDESMLGLAFKMSGEYVADNVGHDVGITVEFTYGVHLFRVAAEPLRRT